MIDFSLIKTIPANESHQEFSFTVKKAAMGGYITRVWSWDEKYQRELHAGDWQQKRPQVILYDKKPIGTIRVFSDDNCINVEQFYILPEYQNKGIGSFLLQQILDDADKKGLLTKLGVMKINPAISLYRCHSFEVIGSNEWQYLMERKPVKT